MNATHSAVPRAAAGHGHGATAAGRGLVSIDVGLAVIDTVREYGEPVTLEQIAEICGCSHQAIHRIEQRALAKLRAAAAALEPGGGEAPAEP